MDVATVYADVDELYHQQRLGDLSSVLRLGARTQADVVAARPLQLPVLASGAVKPMSSALTALCVPASPTGKGAEAAQDARLAQQRAARRAMAAAAQVTDPTSLLPDVDLPGSTTLKTHRWLRDAFDAYWNEQYSPADLTSFDEVLADHHNTPIRVSGRNVWTAAVGYG